MEPKFIHLRLHTEYSLSDGLITIPSLMEKISSDRMPALAITDLSNLYAAVKFYQAAIQAGVKPILGTDIWVLPETKNAAPTRLTLLCQNQQGYLNLLKLISKSYLEEQSQGTPLVKKAWLKDLGEGFIVLSGGR